MYQKRACRNLQYLSRHFLISSYCIRKEPAAIYNVNSATSPQHLIVSEKSLPQSTIRFSTQRPARGLYQKRACRNLQFLTGAAAHLNDCIRKEPAAIYNPLVARHRQAVIVSEKSLPQSTIAERGGRDRQPLYQKRACRNLQFMPSSACSATYCIRKEPAAIYNAAIFSTKSAWIVSEKSLPQSTIPWPSPALCARLYQKRACRNLQYLVDDSFNRQDCIRKEPAAIYNESFARLAVVAIVSEKSLPQSTMYISSHLRPPQLYQKRACRNLQYAPFC